MRPILAFCRGIQLFRRGVPTLRGEVVAQKDVDVAGWQVGIKEGENQRVLFADNVVEHAGIEQTARIDRDPRLEPKISIASRNLEKFARSMATAMSTSIVSLSTPCRTQATPPPTIK